MIDTFLQYPDNIIPNPHYISAAPMNIYNLNRVESFESSPDFKIYKEKFKNRKDASTKAVKTKKIRLLEKVAKMEIHITRKNLEDMIQEAIESYNAIKSNMASERQDFDYKQASMKDDKAFLYRITVNFLRDRCTPYERMVDKIAYRVDKKEAYALLNERIFKRISQVYPELTEECKKQLEIKIMGEQIHGQF